MHRTLPALILILPFLAVAGPAGALPPAHERAAMPALVVPAGGCHRDVRRHFVPEFGRAASHVHRRDCGPVAAEERRSAPSRCHRDARRHFEPGWGNVLHRHVGDDCAVRVINRSSTGG